jgi:hypothetical protein
MSAAEHSPSRPLDAALLRAFDASSDRKVLRLPARLAAGVPVHLSDAVCQMASASFAASSVRCCTATAHTSRSSSHLRRR